MRGVAVTDGFHLDAAASCRCLNPHHGHGLAASWRIGCCLPLIQLRRHSQSQDYGAQSHGLFTRCLRLTAVLRAFALVGPPKTCFQLVVNLDWVGLITH